MPSSKAVELNMVANTTLRAPGESVGSFALESAIDDLAEKLGIDPVELRRRNDLTLDWTKGTRFSRWNLVEAFRLGADRFRMGRPGASPPDET
ncbi:MAG: xanthine dehydrogenase family protein molybdopterin-binding subunit [Chelatococcus sp.]|uniref:molybdopterin cofactor-binding domain-containing protein n=1 Tax=Chelatococcus sp. TaxID=1953771 RepID=UPI0025BEC2B6|nr:molybdopterin cofactor-binding domain-containing protein [Chelatococcus sp.]MBX3538985.1 xanthine dehydrogenase family protein molybdopterin-binding subunit [Chelatococcus sp.]